MCVTSQSKIKLCRDGPTYVDHVLSKDRGHNASLDPQLLGLKSSTLPPSHCAPFAVWRKCNAVLLSQLCHTGLLVISFAACFFFFFSFSFLQQLMQRAYAATFLAYGSKWCLVSNLNTHIILKLAKSLIRLRVCAGKSEHLLVRHTILLLVCAVCEISILGFNPCIPITPYRVLWQTVKT